MSCKIITYPLFERSIKKLGKKYRSIKDDYQRLLNELNENPLTGSDLGRGLHKVRMAISASDLGRGLHKVRMAISAKGKGKSGGARIITLIISYTQENAEIGLLYIYDKSERETLTDAELTHILRLNNLL